MTTQDLLDELRRNVLRDKSGLVSGPVDALWDDAALVRYLDEAQRIFATRALVLHDSTTPSVVNVGLIAGVAQYRLHPSIIAVLSARYGDDTRDLHRTGHSALTAFVVPDTRFFDPNALDTLAPGQPVAWASDEQIDTKAGVSGAVSLRVYPAPSAEYASKFIYLRTIRKPIKSLSLDALDAPPEIPEDYHYSLLDWAAYRAMRNIDSDAGGFTTADKFRETFDEMVAQARKEVLRKLFAPTPWAFGRGGFVWEH